MSSKSKQNINKNLKRLSSDLKKFMKLYAEEEVSKIKKKVKEIRDTNGNG